MNEEKCFVIVDTCEEDDCVWFAKEEKLLTQIAPNGCVAKHFVVVRWSCRKRRAPSRQLNESQFVITMKR